MGNRATGSVLMATLHEYRKRAVAILDRVTPADIKSWQCKEVCQGRYQSIKNYSGCADLAHYMYWELGLRHSRLNRDDGAARRWKPGVNVGRIAYWLDARVIVPGDITGLSIDGGDVLIRWTKTDTSDAHVVCVTTEEPDLVSTAEYGQARPGVGRIFTRQRKPLPGERPWQVWLPLGSVLAACGIDIEDYDSV